MQGQSRFSGVIAPVLTPFGEDGAPDPQRFIAHCRWLLEVGCTALAPFGTTSEATSLGLDERMELLEELVNDGVEPEKLLVGTGCCSVTDTAVLTQHAVELGCGGVLMLPPFYYKTPSEDGLVRYFADVIEAVAEDQLRVYLYNFPRLSGVPITVPLIRRLTREFPEIVVGLKDSSGDMANTKAVLEALPGFTVFPGSEAHLLEAMRHGAGGCITASVNVAAPAIRRLYDGWQSAEADALQADIAALRKGFEAHPLIPQLKAVIAHYRQDPGWAAVRPPFMPLAPGEAENVVRTLARDYGFRLEFAAAA